VLEITHSHSDITRDNVTHSDRTVEICQFFLIHLHFPTNEYIFEGMNGTIVFLVDDCFVMKNQCMSLNLNKDAK